MTKNLVVGAGITGITIANLLATQLDEKVLLIDKKTHIGGNCFDYRNELGIMMHKFGSHIFHTNNEKVWNYLNKFTKFNDYKHKVVANISDIATPVPFNLNSLYRVFDKELAKRLETKLLEKYEYGTKVSIWEFQNQDDEDLKKLADFIYENVFLGYTTKQWGISPKEVDKSVTARVPVYISRDDTYFQDKYQGIPQNGYSKMFVKMVAHKNIDIMLGTDYKELNQDFDRIFFTGSIDEFFDYEYGKLPYRSVYFEEEICKFAHYQPTAVVNYPVSEKFTRIHEYKYYLNDESKQTVIVREYSENFELGKNERFYPIQNEENVALYNKYLEKAKELKNVYFAGRLGDYKYYNMDQAVLRAMELIEKGVK